MSTTTKKDLINRIAESNRVKNTLVKNIVQNFLDEITAELAKSNRLEFRDFVFLKSKSDQQEKPRILRLWSQLTSLQVEVSSLRWGGL